MNWLTGLLDRVFAVLGALVGTQAPMFIQQYHQQLSGRVAELKLHIEAITKVAAQGQKNLQQYIEHFMQSGDPDFMRQGELMLALNERYETLLQAFQNLTSASVLSKPIVFIREFNWDIASSTFVDFQTGVPFTLEGLAYAIIGIGLGFGVFCVIGKAAKLVYLFFQFGIKKIISFFSFKHSSEE
ncbi:MAG: DUF2937 family protein [Parachlamydiaceae bacterium]